MIDWLYLLIPLFFVAVLYDAATSIPFAFLGARWGSLNARLSLLRPVLALVLGIASLKLLGFVSEINQVGVRGKVGSAKATEVEAGQRPVPLRATTAQPTSPHSQNSTA
ncbi:MAG: hypothetical protein WC205_14310 [Opitutaceae bacterium]|jgi:hypothetical protein